MFRHYITIGVTTTEVFPLGFNGTAIVDEKERDQVFYRSKFSGEILFKGDDFELIWAQEQADPCERITYLAEQLTNSGWETYFEGYFTSTDGNLDLDKCTFRVSPSPDDKYEDLLNNGDREFNILDVTPTVTTYMGATTFARNRWLLDVIEYLADQVVTGLTVQSNFFTADLNPVTLTNNTYKSITIAQKSDIKDPTSSNPALMALLSFTELMDILKTMFKVYWDIDGAVLRVEHISFFEAGEGMDLRTQRLHDATNKYRYNKEEMPKFEKYSFMEAKNMDFVGVPIYYDSLCVNKDPDNNVREYSVRVSTDVQYLGEEPDAISNDGFVLLCNYEHAGSYYVHFGPGIFSAGIRYNMPLSWSHIHQNFFKHDMILPEGYVNNVLETFFSSRKNKLQEVSAIVCHSDEYDPRDYILTSLGDIFGENAHVRRAERKPTGETKFAFIYGPEGIPPAIIPSEVTLWVQLSGISAGDDITCTLSEPLLYDIVFWIYLNDSTCQEIFIPARDIFFEDTLDDDLPIKFNVSDTSMNDISVQLNDGSDLIVTTLDCTPAASAVSITGIDPIIDGLRYTVMDIDIDYNNTGTAGTYEIEWEMVITEDPYGDPDVVINSGSIYPYFPTGIGTKNISGILYPNKSFFPYFLRIKSISDAGWQTSNDFYSNWEIFKPE